jgi:hypothetical protein
VDYYLGLLAAAQGNDAAPAAHLDSATAGRLCRRGGIGQALAPHELHAILVVCNLGLRLRPGLTSGSPRSATIQRVGSP